MARRRSPEGTAPASPAPYVPQDMGSRLTPQAAPPSQEGVTPPVGGRIQQYARVWRSIAPDAWVLHTVTHGYRIEFTSPPPSGQVLRRTPLPASPIKRRALLEEVAALIAKKAISPVFPPFIGGFWSTFFLAPKKTGDWRPILNLKPLNRFIRPQKFRMQTLASVLRCPIKDQWAASLDLKDAYLHIPIHRDDRKWLRFHINGQAYRFKCLPFGLSTAPRVFTRVVGVVGAYLKRRGVNICLYLDDWLIYAESADRLRCHIQLVIQTVSRLGFIVNFKKSHLEPTQMPIFLGARLDLSRGLAFPTDERAANLVSCSRILSEAQSAPALAWLKVLGLMASMVDLVPFCRLQMRVIQIHCLAHYRPSRHPISTLIPMSDLVRRELQWWCYRPNLLEGVVFPRPRTSHVVTTDASLTGWGGHLLDQEAAGLWTPLEAKEHINLLELWAVERSMTKFEGALRGQGVLIQTDNSTVVAYLNKQGGTRSSSLCAHAIRIINWCRARQIHLRAIHIAGVTNVLADDLSRGRTSGPTELVLSPQVVQTIFQRYYHPVIDLFATAQSKHLPVFCSRYFDSRAFATDALSINWTGMVAYAFPPISLLPRVIEKIQQEDCEVLLVAPYWPKHVWFRPLVDLLAGRPCLLPVLPDLVRGVDQSRLPQDHLKWTCWPLSGNDVRRRVFQRELQSSSPGEDDSRRLEHTLSVWRPTSGGAVIEALLQVEPLFQ